MASTLGPIRRIFFRIFHRNEIFIACGFGAAQQTLGPPVEKTCIGYLGVQQSTRG